MISWQWRGNDTFSVIMRALFLAVRYPMGPVPVGVGWASPFKAEPNMADSAWPSFWRTSEIWDLPTIRETPQVTVKIFKIKSTIGNKCLLSGTNKWSQDEPIINAVFRCLTASHYETRDNSNSCKRGKDSANSYHRAGGYIISHLDTKRSMRASCLLSEYTKASRGVEGE